MKCVELVWAALYFRAESRGAYSLRRGRRNRRPTTVYRYVRVPFLKTTRISRSRFPGSPIWERSVFWKATETATRAFELSRSSKFSTLRLQHTLSNFNTNSVNRGTACWGESEALAKARSAPPHPVTDRHQTRGARDDPNGAKLDARSKRDRNPRSRPAGTPPFSSEGDPTPDFFYTSQLPHAISFGICAGSVPGYPGHSNISRRKNFILRFVLVSTSLGRPGGRFSALGGECALVLSRSRHAHLALKDTIGWAADVVAPGSQNRAKIRSATAVRLWASARLRGCARASNASA